MGAVTHRTNLLSSKKEQTITPASDAGEGEKPGTREHLLSY